MEHILGQTRALQVLDDLLHSGRLHHAYIFHGPAGVGKFTTALAFARILLCHDPQARTQIDGQERVRACDTCASCQRLVGHATESRESDENSTAVAHPDLHVVTKELALYSDERSVRERKLLTIPVEVLRKALLDPVYLASHMGHRKVFILNEAQLLNHIGQNLLLKTLEEPPDDTFLILVTSQEDRLLATIRSRCHRVVFAPIGNDLVGDFIDGFVTRRADEESSFEADQRQWLIDFAAGSPGRALLALEYDLYEWGRTVSPTLEAMTRGKFSTEFGKQMLDFINDFAERWVKNHSNASKDAANKQAAALMWSLIAQHAIRRVTQEAVELESADPQWAQQSLEPWLGVVEALGGIEQELASNVNMGLVCDHLASRLFRSLGPVGPTRAMAGASR